MPHLRAWAVLATPLWLVGLWLGGLWLAGAAALIASEGEARIVDLAGERENGQLLLSFHLLDAFGPRTEERIQSGLPTSFRYEARLEKRRRWWLNNTVDVGRLEVVAMYNAITREYLVNFKQDGRLVDSRVVKSLAELRDTMTVVHRRALLEVPDADPERTIVRVRAALGAKTVLGVFPTTAHTSWAEWSVPLAGRTSQRQAP